MIENTLCFTGHRAQKLPWRFNENAERCLIMKKRLRQEIIEAINHGYTNFISGMALGFDMIASEIVLELKKKYPNIQLICALPCKDQTAKWPDEQKQRYKKLLAKADSIHCLYEHWQAGCELERNDYMLANSSLVIALFNGQRGGTASTIQKAKKAGLKIVEISP